MRTNAIIAVSLIIACLSCCEGAPAQTCELIYKWEPGETLSTRLTIDQERTIGPLAPPEKQAKKKQANRREEEPDPQSPFLPIDQGSKSQHLVCDFDMKVAEVDPDGVARIEMTFRRVEAAADLADGERFTFDSAKPAKKNKGTNEREQTLAGLIGKTMSMRIARDGRMIEAQGVERLIEALVALQEQDALGLALLDQLRGGEQGTGIDDMFRMGPRFLPGRPVRRGESWTTEVEHTLPIVGKIRSVWDSTLATLQRRGKGQIATIKSKADIRVNTPPAGTTGLPPGIDLEFMPGKGEAETIFDVEAGRAVSAEMSLELSVEVRAGEMVGVMQTMTCRMRNEVIENMKR